MKYFFLASFILLSDRELRFILSLSRRTYLQLFAVYRSCRHNRQNTSEYGGLSWKKCWKTEQTIHSAAHNFQRTMRVTAWSISRDDNRRPHISARMSIQRVWMYNLFIYFLASCGKMPATDGWTEWKIKEPTEINVNRTPRSA